VWDTAGVAACLTKYQRLVGHDVTVVKLGNWDGKGIDEYYGTPLTYEPHDSTIYKSAKAKLSHLNFGLKKLLYRLWSSYPTLKLYWFVIRNKKHYDLLHVHSMWHILFFVPFKPKIFEFHGDDVRKTPSMYSWLRRLPAKLFVSIYGKHHALYVSTPDLLSEVPNSVWIPNIVDTEHFKPMPNLRVLNSALYCSAWYEDDKHAVDFAKQHNLALTVLDRKGNDWVDHRDFPKYLNQFEYYIDRVNIPSLSKTALEALACGLKVVDWQGKVLEGLPDYHKPENVVAFTMSIYEEVLKSNSLIVINNDEVQKHV
jgi:glycosyltransferase involved in cell wall biosynthesis